MKNVTTILKGQNVGINHRDKTMKCATCGEIIEIGVDQFLIIGGEDGHPTITHDMYKCYSEYIAESSGQ